MWLLKTGRARPEDTLVLVIVWASPGCKTFSSLGSMQEAPCRFHNPGAVQGQHPDTMEARLQEATETVLQLTAGGVEEINMYPDTLSFMLGEDFMPEVYSSSRA